MVTRCEDYNRDVSVYVRAAQLLNMHTSHIASVHLSNVKFCRAALLILATLHLNFATCVQMQRCRLAEHRQADVLVKTFSMQRQACMRVLPKLLRVRTPSLHANTTCRAFSAKTGEPKATPVLLDKMKDKDLLKVHGFIGGQWVSASDGTVMEVLPLKQDLHCASECATARAF